MSLASALANLAILLTRIQNWFKQLNAFDNPKKTTGNNFEAERRATYVYLLLILCAALSILALYNALVKFPYRFTVTNPPLEQYQQLEKQYGVDALNCPCSQVSITYSSFLNFDCSFHSVCSSDFVSDFYLQNLFEIYDGLDITKATRNAFTLHGTIFSHFQTLRTMCFLVKDTFKDAREQYITSSMLSTSMVDSQLFDKQMNTSLTRFYSTLPVEFLSNLNAIRGMIQSNALVSLYSTNWFPVIHNWLYYANVYMQPQFYGNCSCFTSSSCTQPSNPFIRGYLVGCNPLESLLRGSIECLYEQTCIDDITKYINLSSPAPNPLNIRQTRFDPKETVDRMIEEMFIENCLSNVSYSQFFDQCYPVSCTITLDRGKTLITVVAVLLGLYGGLTVVLKLVVYRSLFFSFLN